MSVTSYVLGQPLMLGGQSAITGYIVEKEVLLDKEVHNRYEIDNADGERASIIVPSTVNFYDKVQLSLTCLVTAAPATDWPKNKLVPAATSPAVNPYGGWYVDSVTWDKEAKPNTVSVTLINYGLTVPA